MSNQPKWEPGAVKLVDGSDAVIHYIQHASTNKRYIGMRHEKLSFGNAWIPMAWTVDGYEYPPPSDPFLPHNTKLVPPPKQYRPFANAAEYFANRREGSAVDGKNNTIAPGFFAVVSANQPYCWVAFGTKIVRFDWAEAFEKLQFRHHDNSTSPFGIEVKE